MRDLSLSVGSLVEVLRLNHEAIQSVVALKARLNHGVMALLIMAHAVREMSIRLTGGLDLRSVKGISVDIKMADMPSVAHAEVIATSMDRNAWVKVGHHFRAASSIAVHHRRWLDAMTRSVVKDRITPGKDRRTRSLARVTADRSKRVGEAILDMSRSHLTEMEQRGIRGR
ncbi:MAG: hypothetical protein ABL974_21780 [Prosthecobacter sp.]